MSLAPLHRRISVLMGLAALLAFAGGAGFEPVSAILAAAGLIAALFWQPDTILSDRLDRIWLTAAAVLAARALWHVFMVGDDVVVPIVHLLLLLMCGEALKSEEGRNDARLYALSFALVLASTAYRPGVLFATAFAAYVVLATVALSLGHIRGQAQAHESREPRLGRSFFVAVVGVSMLALLASGLVFVAFPRVPRGWAGQGVEEVTRMAGFGEEVALDAYGARIYANPEIVLRVEFPDGAPSAPQALHWRGRAYDHFDGVRWSRTRGLPAADLDERFYLARWGGPTVRHKVFAARLEARVLFGVHPVLQVAPSSAIRPIFYPSGDIGYIGRVAPVYTTLSLARTPDPPRLRGSTDGLHPGDAFLQVPAGAGRLGALADSLTAGASNRYDRVLAIQRWLQTEFRYTLELPRTRRETGLEHFLFERRAGHCEYFSTALAVLLRTQGIPTRNVNGFLGGEWNRFGDYLAVTQNQAHSWVEVWFAEYGWVPFDPTPSGTGAAGPAAPQWRFPGRFVLDLLEHRWSKWVLDYDLAKQIDVLRTVQETVQPRRRSGGAAADGLPGGPFALLLLAAALALGAWFGLRAFLRRAGVREPTRTYLRLRRLYGAAGFGGGPGEGPLAFQRRLQRAGAPGADAAQRVVDVYVRTRFGGMPLGEADERELKETAKAARRAVKKG